MTVMSFDTWRERYDRMTFREHQNYNAQLAELYPVQRSFNADACARFLNEQAPQRVVELGGWDGALAGEMLQRFPDIKSWVNYDITPNVPQICEDPRYHKVVLIDWPWHCRISGDVLIASHVFEHMRMLEVEKTIMAWNVTSIYADVPMGDWRGYQGTHILEASPEMFVERIRALGYGCEYGFAGESLIAQFHRLAVTV